jgi:sugar O-acyltransferase (sialic acid O-acetyltransferase NeuD family)
MKRIAIIGAGGFAKEVLWLIRTCIEAGADFEPWGFVDDAPELHGKILCDQEVRGGLEVLAREKDVLAVCAIGNPWIRRKVVERSMSLGVKFASVISPDLRVSKYIQVGEGSVICAGNILTTQIVIGRHVHLNLDCTVGHDVAIGDYATISPGVHISGACKIGREVLIGTGTVLIQGITVGEGSVVGAGATVTRSIPSFVTAVGTPARVIKEHRPD